MGDSGSESGEDVDDEAGAGSDSEDGGFDLSTKGEKAAPGASDEDEEQDSDAEEAEIWKVSPSEQSRGAAIEDFCRP